MVKIFPGVQHALSPIQHVQLRPSDRAKHVRGLTRFAPLVAQAV
jgi:hypothetical protein